MSEIILSNRVLNMADIHFGKLIQNELQRQRYSVAWFAKEMSYTRGNMYKILNRAHLNTDFVIRASRKLNHDFFRDASKILTSDKSYTFNNN